MTTVTVVARYQAGLKTEARIVGAARELLGEKGLEGTTLKAICDRAGIRAGSFYNLFESKEEVILKVIAEAIAAVDPDPAGETDTLEELVDAYVAFFLTQSTLARIYVQIAVTGSVTADGLGVRMLHGHQTRVDRFRAAIRRHDESLSEDDATIRAELLLAVLNGLAFRWSLDPEFELERHAELALSEAVGRSLPQR
jgi:AcrR family transcriptional regulator